MMDVLKKLELDKSKAKGTAKPMPKGKADYLVGDVRSPKQSSDKD